MRQGSQLETFLAVNDLDDVLNAVRRIDDLSHDDEARILQVLSDWDKPQAVANLLMYPKLIPLEQRLDFLIKGLQENAIHYFKLAAVVGLQSIEIEDVPENQRQEILRMLVNLIKTYSGVLATRASATLNGWVQSGDGHAIAPLLRHPDSTVQHNILASLIEIVGFDTIVDFLDVIFAAGGYPPETIAATKAKLSQIKEINPENDSAKPFALSPVRFTLYSYIPNFSAS